MTNFEECPKRPKREWLYILRAESQFFTPGKTLIKIGVTNNPRTRIDKWRHSLPFDFTNEVLRTSYAEDIESFWKSELYEYRSIRSRNKIEWFWIPAGTLKIIKKEIRRETKQGIPSMTHRKWLKSESVSSKSLRAFWLARILPGDERRSKYLHWWEKNEVVDALQ